MPSLFIELLVILMLILANGFFACAEFAVISIRKSRVAQLVAAGDPRARIIEGMQKDPHRLLAVAQIGMTLVGATASALGGVVAIRHLKPVLEKSAFEAVRNAAEPAAVSFMVMVLSYFILVIGELAPKTLGLQYADPVALHFAKPLQLLARVGTVVVSILSLSSRGLLRLFGISNLERDIFSREEIQHIVAEGHEAGAFTAAESEYIKNIFDFTHTAVREVMVPRTRMVAIDLDLPHEEIVAAILENQYSRYPVYRGAVDEIVGFIHAKDFLGQMVRDPAFDVAAIIRPSFFVPEVKKVNELLKEMQRQRVHIAIVVDEYGGVSGMATTEDLLEELVGEIEDEHDVGEPQRLQTLADGSLLVDALLSINELKDLIEISLDDDFPFDTVAGLVLHKLGRFPEQGEVIEWGGYLFTCVDVARNVVLTVKISRSGSAALAE